MEELQGVHYDAFISYRHSELDSFIAENLHKKLEAFKLPKSARSKAKSGKTRITRIFRDVDELPLSDNLSDPINNALANSDFLITICTPRYPQSRWCLKEIETFLQMHDREHILVVLAEDEPYNSFPEILTYEEVEVRDDNGNVTFVKKDIEPLAADTRGENKKEILKAMDTAVMKLCAAIFGMNYDDLRQRHREQKIRKMATVFGSIGAAVLMFAVFATVMLIRIGKQNIVITQQYAELNDKYAGTMAGISETLLSMGRKKDAVYAVSKVMPETPGEQYNSKALKSLYDAMNVYDIGETYSPVCSYDAANQFYEFGVSYDNKYVCINDWDTFHIYDGESGDEILVLNPTEEEEYFTRFAFCGSQGMVVATGSNVKYISLPDGAERILDEIDTSDGLFQSEDGMVTLSFAEDILTGIDNSGNILYTIDVSEALDAYDLMAFSADFDEGNFIVVLGDLSTYYILMADEMTGDLIVSFYKDCNAEFCATLRDRMVYFAITGQGVDGYSSSIYAIDTVSGQTMWIREANDFLAVNIYTTDKYVYVYDRYTMLVLEREKGGVINFYSSDKSIIECWTEGDTIKYVSQEGEIFQCDELSCFDYTENMFTGKPGDFLFAAKYSNGDLFYWFDKAAYLTKYSGTKTKPERLENAEYEIRVFPEETADEAFEDGRVGSSRLCNFDSAFYSDDREYIVAVYSNKTKKVFDASTMEIVGSPEISDTNLVSLIYYRELGNYVISSTAYSYILDEDFNPICRTAIIEDVSDGKIVFRANEYDFETQSYVYYALPIVDYAELVSRAKEYLGDYEPAEEIKDKYGIK